MKHTEVKSLIIGDGWSALGAAAFLLHAGEEVLWFSGTGARLIAPLPALEAGPGSAVWRDLMARYGIETGEIRTGCFVREFRNKSFREPAWTKAPTPDMRREVRDEILEGAEARFVGSIEARFESSLAEIEENLRAQVLAHPKLTRLEGEEVHEIHARESAPESMLESGRESEGTAPRIEIVLGSGDILTADRVFYADRWSSLLGVQGLPKPLPFLRNRKPVGALQAMFTHDPAIAQGIDEGFYGACNKDAGEETARNVWGHFFSEGQRSIWTLYLEPEEAEDNHEATKKLRRLKQACSRMFGGPEWLSEGKTDFLSTVTSEQYRFEEGVVYTAGEAPSKPIVLKGFPNLFFLTDAYGPSKSLEQVGQLLGEELGIVTRFDSSEAADFEAGSGDEPREDLGEAEIQD